MPIPSWATSMVRNYRTQFREVYLRETTLSDDQIWSICNTIYDDNGSDLEDAARVEVMRETEED